MQGSDFDELGWFERIHQSGARALLIGRRSLAARRRGRYALENDEHVDVLVAREVPTLDGTVVRFEDLWLRRRTLTLGSGTPLHVPTIDDLILTKRFVARPKDLEDIRLLTILKNKESQA